MFTQLAVQLSLITHHQWLLNSSPAAYMSLIPSPGAVAVEIKPTIIDAIIRRWWFGGCRPPLIVQLWSLWPSIIIVFGSECMVCLAWFGLTMQWTYYRRACGDPLFRFLVINVMLHTRNWVHTTQIHSVSSLRWPAKKSKEVSVKSIEINGTYEP